MSKLASAAAGFVSGVMCYYFVRDRVWGRAEGVAAQLQEMQADVPALARRPVKVRRPLRATCHPVSHARHVGCGGAARDFSSATRIPVGHSRACWRCN